MNRCLAMLGLAGWMLVATSARADVTVTDAWVRATAPRQVMTEVFMKLRSTGDLSLINAASPAANIVEIQKPVTSGNERAMRSIDEVVLPAGKTVELAPGGYQVMLIELRKPLSAGEKVPLTLTFVTREGNIRSKLAVTAEVRPVGAVPDRR